MSLSAVAQNANQQQARKIFKQIIEVNTTDSVWLDHEGCRGHAAAFVDAGFLAADVQLLEPNHAKRNARPATLAHRVHAEAEAGDLPFSM